MVELLYIFNLGNYMDYWQKLKSVIDPIDNMYFFGREEKVIEKYNKHKETIDNINEYLFKNLFKNGDKIVIKENDYPYKLPNKILHYLIWLHPKEKITHDQVEFCLKEFLEKNKDLNITDHILFINNRVNKSIETIEHYHVLLKLK